MLKDKFPVIDSSQMQPNELGRIHVSINKQQICPIEANYIGNIMARSKKNNNNPKDIDANAKPAKENIDQKAIDAIWKHMGLGHIDISYACVGYSMDGRPILNYDEFTNLLVTYGFNIQDVMMFIDDFANHSTQDNTSPIVMFTTNTSAIMTNIEPIVQ